MRGRVRIVLLVGTAVFMLWSSPTTAAPSLPASPMFVIGPITLPLVNNSANGVVFGGQATGSGGFGVIGFASAPSSQNFGVAGASNSDKGTGVFGLALATSCPDVSPSVSLGQTCVGVIGQSSATSGTTAGVAGLTQSRSVNGGGVVGMNMNNSATSFGSGVLGLAQSPGGAGVFGRSLAPSGGFGVAGSAPGGAGVTGEGLTGVSATSNSPFGEGVVAVSTATSGSTAGVRALTNSPNGAAISGQALNGGLAGKFLGPVVVSGDFSVTGSKAALVDTVSYGKRQLYAVESPESWFEDFGSAKLTNGRAIVRLDPIFAQTVNTADEYHIFLTPKGECKGLYVANQRATSFEVKELQNGKSSIAFDYRFVAKRKGYERARLPAPTK